MFTQLNRLVEACTMTFAVVGLKIVRLNVPLLLAAIDENCGGVKLATALTATEAELLYELPSEMFAPTLAEFMKVPALFACNVSVSCAPALLVSVPMFHDTCVPLRLTGNCGELLLETSVILDGSVSNTTTLLE